jgi:hypothetical protein
MTEVLRLPNTSRSSKHGKLDARGTTLAGSPSSASAMASLTPQLKQRQDGSRAPLQRLDGEWAYPMNALSTRLDYLDVSQENRDHFLAAFGQDIRELTSADFHQPVGDI